MPCHRPAPDRGDATGAGTRLARAPRPVNGRTVDDRDRVLTAVKIRA
jgi:hypothetical protein